MKIVYPYNEVLPLRRAHDAYIVRACAALADQGHDVVLLVGKGSYSQSDLFDFYKIDPQNRLKIVTLPILRRNNFLRLQCNWLFFFLTQRYLQMHKPDCVILSVLKQGSFHLKRRIKNVLYIYEVHQLSWYPTFERIYSKRFEIEKEMFQACDLVTVTTNALKEILQKSPYQIETLVEVVPLACDFQPLDPKEKQEKILHIFYVGQLYATQGMDFLLKALRGINGIHLHVVGGKPEEIETYKKRCETYDLTHQVTFEGFFSTKELRGVLKRADAFITTFQSCERMPYVAHTKLYEYQSWQRPIIAPNLNVVQEHLEKGALLYEPESIESLKEALKSLQDPNVYQKLLKEAGEATPVTWEKRGCLFNKILHKISKTNKNRHIRNT